MSFFLKSISKNLLNKLNILARTEGYNPGLYDLEIIYDNYPNLIAGIFYNSELVGYVILFPYNSNDTDTNLVRDIIVHPNFRSLPYQKLIDSKFHNDKLANLNSVFITRARIKKCTNKINIDVENYRHDHETLLLNYDLDLNYIDRGYGILETIRKKNVITKLIIKNNNIVGYGVMREAYEGWRIGPLVANTSDYAVAILQALQFQAGGLNLDLDIPHFLEQPEHADNNNVNNIISSFDIEKIYTLEKKYIASVVSPNLYSNLYSVWGL